MRDPISLNGSAGHRWKYQIEVLPFLPGHLPQLWIEHRNRNKRFNSSWNEWLNALVEIQAYDVSGIGHVVNSL